MVIFLNISMRHERDVIGLTLITEKDKSAVALERVYAQKGEEIKKLDNHNKNLSLELDKSKKDNVDCLEHHARLLKQLGEENKKKQSQRMAKYETNTPYQTRSTTYKLDAIFDITTSEDTLFNEEAEWIKKRVEEKRT